MNIEHVDTISGVCCGLGAKPPDDKLSEETGEKFAEVRPQGHHLHGDRGGHPRGQPPLRRHTTCEPSLTVAGHADWCTVNVAGPSHRRLPPDVCGKPLLYGGGHQGKRDEQNWSINVSNHLRFLKSLYVMNRINSL